MIVCPVCEHRQEQGAECEVCGKKLLHGADAVPYVPPVEGLELTGHAPVDAGSERMGELEATRFGDAGEVDFELTPGIEETRAAPVDVSVEPVADVERTEAGIPGDAPTVLPAFVTCRYCRTPGMPGERICSRCGMRLSVAGPAGAEEGPGAEARTCSCGAKVRGGRCGNCGARLA